MVIQSEGVVGNVFNTIPTFKPQQEKPGQLTSQQIQHFFDKGWLVIPDLIEIEVLETLKKGITKQTDELADRLFGAGKITNKHQDKGFFQRMIHLEKEFPGAAVLLHKTGILPDGAKELWSYNKLLNIGEQLLGPDIAGNPVWNLRVKLPEHEEGVVPWHQDNAYYTESSLNTLMLTAWVPLLDTSEFNGGMQVIDGTQKSGILAKHVCCAGGTFYVEIPEDVIESTFGCQAKDKSVCEVPYGGVLLLSNMIVHRSSTNRSNDIRWSMDLRWQDPSQPNGRESPEERMPLMRSKQNEDLKDSKDIDWSILTNRQAKDREVFLEIVKGDQLIEDAFETRLGGLWMRRWPVVHHNKHTEYEQNKFTS